MSTSAEPADPYGARRARHAPGLLRAFNDAGVLAAADVHVARRLSDLTGEADPEVTLAIALAVRAPRIGHVHLDLARVQHTVALDAERPPDLEALPWPSAAEWRERVAASALVALGDGEGGGRADTTEEAPSGSDRPLRLVGDRLYLDRYWREERQVAADLRALAAHAPVGVREDVLAEGLARLFVTGAGERQPLAAAAAALSGLAVVAGGPGTGKTTTVARIVALLCEQARGQHAPHPLVALAAPTGRAAARLAESVHREAGGLAVAEDVRDALMRLEGSTLHRLLGFRPGSHSRFAHHRGRRLPHDVVVVDETSMVSLTMMARLLEAIRPDARLILVGDPGQLASVEAGAVLGDVVGPAARRPQIAAERRTLLERVTRGPVDGDEPPPGATIASGIVSLNRVHRFGGAIAELAEAIRLGDAEATLRALSSGAGAVTWIAVDATDPGAGEALAPVREHALRAARAVLAAAVDGDADRALATLGDFRLLCAHRRGPQGVAAWTSRLQSWLGGELVAAPRDGPWYAGRPLLVTRNDAELGLANGDSGVIVAHGPGRLSAAFSRGGTVVHVSPARLDAVRSAYAMTIHKSQGSQYAAAAVLLGDPTSRLLTRELLYTAATRARRHLVLVATEETVRAAVNRPVARASGLRRRLWGQGR